MYRIEHDQMLECRHPSKEIDLFVPRNVKRQLVCNYSHTVEFDKPGAFSRAFSSSECTNLPQPYHKGL